MHILDQTLYSKATFYGAPSESNMEFSPDLQSMLLFIILKSISSGIVKLNI